MIALNGNILTLDQVISVARNKEKVKLTPETKKKVSRSRAVIEKKLSTSEVIYGVNTGVGELSNTAIPLAKMKELQKNMIRSHSAGVGDFLPEEVVRAMMVLRIHSLAHGYSGVRLKLIETLTCLLNEDILPIVPGQGSLGASGDLVPLAHIALALIGEGDVLYKGKKRKAKSALKQSGIEPLELKAKEGLALINGTQLMTALGVLCLYEAKNLARHADIAAALSTDVLKGSINHTDPLIHKLRPHNGQGVSAANIRKLMEGSDIWSSHQEGCEKVQDAYSLRCAPQVHGASRDTFDYIEKVITTEINAVTDNPLIFPDDDKILSGGNFHGQPLALVLDFLGIALAELGNISERRTARLVDHKLSRFLPPFLTKESGLNSGFMVAQYTAAALVSENKILSHPASVDSITSSANQEDHVSMGAIAGTHARTILKNTSNVIAIELLCAAQALDFHHPLKTSKALEIVYDQIREVTPTLKKDRVLHKDIEKINNLIDDKTIINKVEEIVNSLN